MSARYTADGRRKSSMAHASRGHECSLCGRTVFGNGGVVSHGRGHVKRGEAVELVKDYGVWPSITSRLFLAPGDERVERYRSEGFEVVS